VLGFAQLLELDGLTPTRRRPTRTGLSSCASPTGQSLPGTDQQ